MCSQKLDYFRGGSFSTASFFASFARVYRGNVFQLAFCRFFCAIDFGQSSRSFRFSKLELQKIISCE